MAMVKKIDSQMEANQRTRSSVRNLLPAASSESFSPPKNQISSPMMTGIKTCLRSLNRAGLAMMSATYNIHATRQKD
jgi:hypothetical protein